MLDIASRPFHEEFAGKRVLITGGLGFIGSNLARKLAALQAQVTLVDSLVPEYGGNLFNVDGIEPLLRVNIADIRDPHSLRHLIQGQDYCFSLAGQTSHLDSMTDPYTDLEINARAQLYIVEACRKYNPGIKLVFASTRQIYGVPQYLPVDERHPVNPVDINGIHKVAGESYYKLYGKVYGLDCCVLRLTNTYGPRMRVKDERQTFLGVWLRRLIEGEPILIYGDGAQLRDLNYVDDVVEAMLLAATHPAAVGQTFNLGSQEVVSLEALAKLMVELNGRGTYEKIPFPAERKKIDIGDYYSSFELIHDQLGWTPKTSLAQGLAATLAFYHAHRQQYW